MNIKIISFVFLLISCSKIQQVEQPRVTFKDVKPILERSCLQCHNSQGQASHLPLTSFEDYKQNAPNIIKWVKNKKMPPFYPESDAHSFINPEFLRKGEREKIVAFLESPTNNSKESKLIYKPRISIPKDGEHLKFKFGKGLRLNPRGFLYQCYFFKIPKKYKNKFLTHISINGKNSRYIHHSLFNISSIKSNKELMKYSHPQFGCILPENNPIIALTNDTGLKLNEKANIVIQVHFDRTMDSNPNFLELDNDFNLNLVFKDDVKRKIFHAHIQVPYTDIDIPYGKVTKSSITLPVKSILNTSHQFKTKNKFKVALSGFMFHMHLYGTRSELKILYNDKDPELILRENNFNFRHHYFAILKEPIPVKDLDNFKLTCYFDNSDNNPNALFLNPTKRSILGGFSSSEEMCYLPLIFELINE